MERICPFLALESDGHAVVAGYDPEHRCGALLPHQAIERARQLSTCLEQPHTACPRYLAAMQVRIDGMPWAPPSPDANLLSTRLVLGPESALRALSAGARNRGRRWAIGAAAALVGIVAVSGGVFAALGSLSDPSTGTSAVGGAGASPQAEESVKSVAPAIGGRPTSSVPAATPGTTPQPIETPEPTRSPDPSPRADDGPRTYVVQEGDTLGDIASAFGTTIDALMVANDLEDSDVILIGQELAIP